MLASRTYSLKHKRAGRGTHGGESFVGVWRAMPLQLTKQPDDVPVITKAILLIACYVLGGIPFGVVVGRVCRGVDIRRFGSGNIGFANALRTLGWAPSLLVFLGDTGKGFCAVGVMKWIGGAEHFAHPELWVLGAAVAVMLGHVFSPFLRFRGGRAVLVSFGVLLGLSWLVALSAFALWLVVAGVSHYISVASMAGAASVPLLMWTFHPKQTAYLWFSIIAALVILLRHIPNLRRLWSGTELRIGQTATETARSSSDAG